MSFMVVLDNSELLAKGPTMKANRWVNNRKDLAGAKESLSQAREDAFMV